MQLQFNVIKFLMNCSLIFAMFINIDTHIFESPQIYVYHLFIIALFPILLLKYRNISLNFLVLTIVFSVIGIIQIILGNNTLSLFTKTFIALFIMLLYYYYYLEEIDYDIEKVFSLYIKGCLLTCYVFILQLISLRIGFSYGYNFSYLGVRYVEDLKEGFQPAAFLSEPSALGILAPALFIALHNIILRKKYLLSTFNSLLIIVIAILSTSSIVYIAILISFIIIVLSIRAFVILSSSLLIGILAFILIYNSSEKFRTRLNDSMEVFVKNSIEDDNIHKFNGSTLTLYHHLLITEENFRHHPLFGTGIGSHAIAHDRYSPFDEHMWWYDLNKFDANSMFLRLASETGILGLVLMFFFMIKFSIKRKHAENVNFWLINKGILVMFLIALLRQGNYMNNGFPLFMLLYYYSYKLNLDLRRENILLAFPEGDIKPSIL